MALNEFVQDFRVVNDVAESTIQMVMDYTISITEMLKESFSLRALFRSSVATTQTFVKKRYRFKSKSLYIKKISIK